MRRADGDPQAGDEDNAWPATAPAWHAPLALVAASERVPSRGVYLGSAEQLADAA
jgi:hypothetical protein